MKTVSLAYPILRFDISDVPNIYFTSDLHFNHANIIKYCNRPFKDVDEMNKVLLDNLNTELSKCSHPILINCGDFIFGRISMADELMSSINAVKIYNVIGNHDLKNILDKRTFTADFNETNIGWNSEYVVEIYENKKKILTFIVSHYPHPMNMFPGSFNIHGHLHEVPNMEEMTGSDKNKALVLIQEGDYYDVGVDGNNFKPIKLEHILRGYTNMPKLKHLDYDMWRKKLDDLMLNNKK